VLFGGEQRRVLEVEIAHAGRERESLDGRGAHFDLEPVGPSVAGILFDAHAGHEL
jgi:hypothetical protein